MAVTKKRKNILEILKERPVVGDGGYVYQLEKRGYVLMGPWNPECVIEHPEAVKQLAREFLRAGSDVLQVFSFRVADCEAEGHKYKAEALQDAAYILTREVARSGDVFIAGSISPSPVYNAGRGSKEEVQLDIKRLSDAFVQNNVDFLLAEYVGFINEAEWMIEVLKSTGLPVACTMRLGPTGDVNNISPGECAVRMAKAGADIIGLNCLFDPLTCLKTIRLMKGALHAANLQPFLMLQPCGFRCLEAENFKGGFTDLPEFPLALEPRLLTRPEMRQWVREAYNLGVRYFGGCCGMEPQHIREIAEELSGERGFRMPGQDMYEGWAAALYSDDTLEVGSRARCTKEYWTKTKPSFGRHDCPIMSKPEEASSYI